LMRLNAEIGTAKSVDIPGYYVGGKTGTSEKVVNGQYSKTRLLAAFMAVFPSDKPRYLVTILLDEPQPTPETKGFATSGWNAAPTAGLVVKRIAPMLGITPRFDLPTADRQILAVTAGTRQ
ncbi:MAG: penicillin-binding protein 2, partial [Pseudorhodoplanes sp.]|nr:penicillin-binding protein 2 [Pseudorhodoplanes sp.]